MIAIRGGKQVQKFTSPKMVFLLLALLSFSNLAWVEELGDESPTNLHNSVVNETLYSDSWQLNCEPAKTNEELSCVASQQVKVKPSEGTVLGVMLAKKKKDAKPHLVLRLSALANVDKGVAIKVDKHSFYRAPINGCNSSVCEVKTLIDDQLLLQMLKGNNMYIAFFINDSQVTYPVSLDNFDETLKKVIESI
jgi:invasion protein IalB